MRAGLLVAIVASIIGVSAHSAAQAMVRRVTSIPAQELAPALRTLMKDRQFQIVYSSELLANQQTPGANGDLTMDEALSQLLSGTGLTYRFLDDKTVTILPVHQTSEAAAPSYARSEENQRIEPPVKWQLARLEMQKVAQESARSEGAQTASENSASKSSAEEVLVTGSRIKGAQSASPTIVMTQKQMLEAGQYNLGEAIRSLTVNFNGGQNPGVAQGASAGSLANQNINGASSINLRGLGPDATLTLLNGRRLSYDSFTQAVDISAIPLAAVESIEVVADGTSALYGSDAVAGVANIKLKTDFQGFAANARYGGTSGGGNTVQEYGAVGGTRWGSGGLMAVYNYSTNSPVRTDQRSFTRYMSAGEIYGGAKQHNVLLSGNQDFSSTVTLSVDALYSRRRSDMAYPPAVTSLVQFTSSPTTKSYMVSPTLTFELPSAWSLAINATKGEDETMYSSAQYNRTTGALSSTSAGCYCNEAQSAEVDAEGRLFQLASGDVRMAVGGGYRKNEFKQYSLTSTAVTAGDRESYFAFSEVSLPLVSAAQNKRGVERLTFTGALRYENYRDIGEVTTPKIGIIYAPSADFELKGSWGKSFKAPTLLQEYQTFIAYLWDASQLGATGYPATATALMSYGGNPNLDPERAETFSATLTFHPEAVPGWKTDLSYFTIDYQDRVIQPVTNLQLAFSNPAYAEFLSFNPTPAQQAALIAQSTSGTITNFASGPYNPANVIALVNDQWSNVAIQKIDGVDLSSSYSFDAAGGSVRVIAQGSWLSSEQKNSTAAPVFDLAGTVYNPPRFRGRTGATWEGSALTLSSFVNYVGRITDTRSTTPVKGGSMTTLDMTAIYNVPSTASLLKDLQLSLSVTNVTDVRPPYLPATSVSIVSYDSTNYSALGRMMNLSVSKRW